MTILHTADWHLGARLVDHDRGPEHQCFLDWLLATIQARKVDLLVVAGDIFDSANPPQSALAQYYRFLARLASIGHCEALIIGGNHDSAATLNAPREILNALQVHVYGAAPAPVESLLAYPDAVICAVPFLRERDVRTAAAGQSHDEVVAAVRAGIKAHYQLVLSAAQEMAQGRPIIATGHLTAIGVLSASSERQIHIGNLAAVGADCFEGFHYTALGHIHRPQSVAGRENVRYVGSPIFLSFDESANTKQVLLLTVVPQQPVQVETLPLPIWRTLQGITTDLATLMSTLQKAKAAAPINSLTPWLEITITDPVPPPDLDTVVRATAEVVGVQVLKLIRQPPSTQEVQSLLTGRSLTETTPEDVFTEKLHRAGVASESEHYQELLGTFRELLSQMQDQASA
jgi:DNA repair protein SbcD/Mre11